MEVILYWNALHFFRVFENLALAKDYFYTDGLRTEFNGILYHRSVPRFKFMKSGPPPTLEGPKTPPKDPDF